MPLPTRSNIQTLDYSGNGQPAAYLEAKTLSPPSATLDYSSFGQPVLGTLAEAGTPTLNPSLYTNVNAFYAPTVTSGSVTQNITPALYSNANTFYSATINVGAVTLTAALYTNTNTFYAQTVTQGGVTLAPALYTNANAFYSPTITTGAVSLTQSARYDNATTFYAASIGNGAVNLAPLLYVNNNVFFSAVVASGSVILAPELLTNTNIFFSPTVGAVTPQPAFPSGSLVRPRKKFRPAILFEFPEEEVVLPDLNAKIRLAGLFATLSIGSVVATSPDPINARTNLAFTQIETYMRGVTAASSWNDPSDDELLFILDFALS